MITKEDIDAMSYSDPYDGAPPVDDAYKQDFSHRYRTGEPDKSFLEGQQDFSAKYSYRSKSLEELAKDCHQASYNNGWWHDPDTGKELPTTGFLGAHVIGCKIGLIGSEVSEIMEGHRKQKMDDKLPQFQEMDVEIVDTIIRLLDLAGLRGTPLTEIYKMKMDFNNTRSDHQLKKRKQGGKLY